GTDAGGVGAARTARVPGAAGGSARGGPTRPGRRHGCRGGCSRHPDTRPAGSGVPAERARGGARPGGRRRDGRPPGPGPLPVAVGLVLLVVFGALFASADPAFAQLIDRALPTFGLGRTSRTILIFVVVTVSALTAGYLVIDPPEPRESTPARRPLQRMEWALP